MKITKDEIMVIAKANGLNKEAAEALLVVASKGLGGTIVDLIKLVALKTENTYDDMVVAAGESTVRNQLNNIKITL